MVLFDNNYPVFIERFPGFDQELHSIFVCQLGDHPLDPNAVVFLLRGEILKSLRIEMPHIPVLQNLFGLFDILFTLIYYVYLHILENTFRKIEHRSYFAILPIPAPQSSTLPA